MRTVSIARFDQMLARHPRLAERFFTESERQYCRSMRRKPAQHFAARLAAKLACREVVGPLRLVEVEVARDAMGAPHLILHGIAAERGRGLCLRVSLSHDGDMAAAIVAGELV